MEYGIFNEDMTSFEAQTAFFSAVDGKTKEEIERLKEDFSKVLPVIMEREFKLAEEGWLFG